MNLRNIAAFCAVVMTASVSYGQSATLTSNTPTAASGSVITLAASVSYPGTPNAVGWSITLPEGWSFVGSNGANLPQISPESGATGTLEWAYANVPEATARFTVTVKTGGKPGVTKLQAKVYLRVGGKQQTVDVAPLVVTVGQ